MVTLGLCVASFLAGGFAVCLRFEKTTGPLIRSAEELARIVAGNRPGLTEQAQEVARLAYLRRKL